MNSFLTMLQRKPNVSIIVEWKVREENIYLYNAGTRSMVASLGTRSLVQDPRYACILLCQLHNVQGLYNKCQ